MKIVVVGDTHFQIAEPYFSVAKEFVKWFLSQPFNCEENIFIHLGDLYHKSNPNPKVHDLGIEWISKIKCNLKYILAGNHDYNRSQNSYSIEPLSKIDNTRLIFKRTYFPNFLNKNINIVMMPFVYDNISQVMDTPMSRKEYYEMPAEAANSFDYLFHHLEDENINFPGKESLGVNLSQYSKAKRIGGHIHKKQKGYLGSSLITRYDERGKDSFVLLIDTETKEKEYIQVPQFLDYIELDYDDLMVEIPFSIYRIFDIVNAPSLEAAREKFKGLYIRDIALKDKNNEKISLSENEVNETKSIRDWFNLFCEKNKITNSIIEKLQGYII